MSKKIVLLIMILAVCNLQILFADNKNIIAGCEDDYPPYCIVDADKNATGFSVELLTESLKVMNKNVVYKIDKWNAVKNALAKGELQVLPLVGRTPEREKLFDFTFPYLTMHGTILVRKTDKQISGISDLENKEVAVLKGDNAEEFLKRIKLKTNIVAMDSFETAIQKLSEGNYDAVVVQKLLALQIIQKLNIQNLKFVGYPLEEFRQSFCFAVKKGDKALLEILNEGLSLVKTNGTFDRLYSKWFFPIENIEQKKIIIGGDFNYPPYEYIDENGNPAGYNVDLSKALCKELNIELEILLQPWNEIRSALENNEIDAIHGMFYSLDREQKFQFSVPHSIINHIIAYNKNSKEQMNDLNDLKDKSIVVMKGDIMHDFAIENGYESQLILVETQKDALELIHNQKYDCALIAEIPALYWIDKYNLTNVMLSEKSVLSKDYCYAVVRENSDLMRKISVGLTQLEKKGIFRELNNKWFAVYENKTDLKIFKYVGIVILVFTLLFLIVFAWSTTLKKKVDEQTIELQNKIKEKEEMQHQLIQSEKLSAVGQLAAGIAHEFNNILAIAYTNVQLIQLLEKKLSDDTDESLKVIVNAIIRGKKIVSYMMSFAKPTTPKKEFIRIEDAIDSVLKLQRQQLELENIAVTTRYSNTKEINVDSGQIEQVFLNIIINARHAIFPKGRGKIDIETKTDNDQLIISITDNGIGMNNETLTKIFTPFFTTKGALAKDDLDIKGTGLGLAVSFMIIEKHNGKIKVESQEGAGTTFEIILPFDFSAGYEPVKIEHKIKSAVKKESGINALLIDDEPDFSVAMEKVLKLNNCKITICGSGKEALELLGNTQFDLIFLDMLLPDMNGEIIFKEIKKINADIPIVFISGQIGLEAEKLKQLGAYSFIQKPFEYQQIAEIINKIKK